MAHLRPYPFGALIRRMFDELRRAGSIFDLPARKFFLGDASLDLSVPLVAPPVAARVVPCPPFA